jgi:hypothetical protein
MPSVGFEPKIPVFERAKTFHALYRAATVIGMLDLVTANEPLSAAGLHGHRILKTTTGTTHINIKLQYSYLDPQCNIKNEKSITHIHFPKGINLSTVNISSGVTICI